jgi:hypothetical protein
MRLASALLKMKGIPVQRMAMASIKLECGATTKASQKFFLAMQFLAPSCYYNNHVNRKNLDGFSLYKDEISFLLTQNRGNIPGDVLTGDLDGVETK